MSPTLGKRALLASLYTTYLLRSLLVSATITERLRHTVDSIQHYKDSPMAVIGAGNTGSLLSGVHRNLTISTTLWRCQGVNSRCYQSFLHYIMQFDPFPRPSFVIAPWQSNLPEEIFEDVRRLDVLDPNVHWIFAVDNHSDVEAFLSNNSCQVVTVTEKDIKTAADGYKSCSGRVTRSTLEWKTLLGYQDSARTYPRNKRLTFVVHEKGTLAPQCTLLGPVLFFRGALPHLQLRTPEAVALLDAYEAINTTVRMQCADWNSGESLLREKLTDFVLYGWLKKESTSVSEYRHAFYTPSSICFYSHARIPIPPSLSKSWTFVFWCLVCVAPFFFTIVLIFHAKGVISPRERVPLSTVVMVLVSSFLGRSPRGLNVGALGMRLMVVAWLLAMFFGGNYLQSSVTASRSVPEFSAEIRTQEQVLKHLNEEIMAPCIGIFSYQFRGDQETEPVYKPLARALDKCRSGCLELDGSSCFEKARRGTHIYFAGCKGAEHRVTLKNGLAVGDDTLATWQTYSAVHIRSPIRYQHRRLMMAVSESGIWMHYGSLYPLPSANDDIVSFDMTVHEYLVVLYAGLTMSLVIFAVEVLWHRYHGGRE